MDTAYYAKVTVQEEDGSLKTYDAMKGKGVPLEGIKEMVGMIAQTGFLKNLDEDSALDIGAAPNFIYYPAHRVLKFELVPELIVTPS